MNSSSIRIAVVENRTRQGLRAVWLGLFVASAWFARADQLELINGDRYNGKLISVNQSEVRFESEIQGLIRLPRDKVSAIFFGEQRSPSPGAIPSAKALPAPGGTNSVEQALRELKQGKASPDVLEKVEREILGTATPESKEKFKEMVEGLLTGKLNLEDIRAQAKSALDQLNELKAEFEDEDLAALLGSYSAILENFLKKTSPPPPDTSKERPAGQK